jgi:hypothetical protein
MQVEKIRVEINDDTATFRLLSFGKVVQEWTMSKESAGALCDDLLAALLGK